MHGAGTGKRGAMTRDDTAPLRRDAEQAAARHRTRMTRGALSAVINAATGLAALAGAGAGAWVAQAGGMSGPETWLVATASGGVLWWTVMRWRNTRSVKAVISMLLDAVPTRTQVGHVRNDLRDAVLCAADTERIAAALLDGTAVGHRTSVEEFDRVLDSLHDQWLTARALTESMDVPEEIAAYLDAVGEAVALAVSAENLSGNLARLCPDADHDAPAAWAVVEMRPRGPGFRSVEWAMITAWAIAREKDPGGAGAVEDLWWDLPRQAQHTRPEGPRILVRAPGVVLEHILSGQGHDVVYDDGCAVEYLVGLWCNSLNIEEGRRPDTGQVVRAASRLGMRAPAHGGAAK